MWAGQPGHLLGERHCWTGVIEAAEPAYQQLDDYPGTADRRVGQASQISAVHPRRGALTARARRIGATNTGMHRDPVHRSLYQLHHDTRQMRNKRLETPRSTPGTRWQAPPTPAPITRSATEPNCVSVDTPTRPRGHGTVRARLRPDAGPRWRGRRNRHRRRPVPRTGPSPLRGPRRHTDPLRVYFRQV